MNPCKTCRYWTSTDNNQEWRECDRARTKDYSDSSAFNVRFYADTRLWAAAEHGGGGVLHTRFNFSCNEWREPEEETS